MSAIVCPKHELLWRSVVDPVCFSYIVKNCSEFPRQLCQARCTTSSSSWTCNACKSVTVSDFTSLRDVQTIASLFFSREYVFKCFSVNVVVEGFCVDCGRFLACSIATKLLAPQIITNIFAARPDFSVLVTLLACMWLPQLHVEISARTDDSYFQETRKAI